jgi:hypothetical protein
MLVYFLMVRRTEHHGYPLGCVWLRSGGNSSILFFIYLVTMEESGATPGVHK